MTLLLYHTKNGNNDDQCFETVFTTFSMNMSCAILKSNIVVYKQVNASLDVKNQHQCNREVLYLSYKRDMDEDSNQAREK